MSCIETVELETTKLSANVKIDSQGLLGYRTGRKFRGVFNFAFFVGG